MRKKNVGAFLLLCSFLVPTRLPAQTREDGGFAPIRVDACRIVRSRKTDVVSPFDGLMISYANTRRRTADRVDFTVAYDGVSRTVSDAGRFSHDAEIRHRFSVFGRYPLVAAPPTCVATSVRFMSEDRRADVPQSVKKKKKRHFWLFFWWW